MLQHMVAKNKRSEKSFGYMKQVNYRLNAKSSSEVMFDAAKGPFQEALKRSGHTHVPHLLIHFLDTQEEQQHLVQPPLVCQRHH